MKIAILETETHFEVVDFILTLLNELEAEVAVVSNQKCIPFLTNFPNVLIVNYEVDYKKSVDVLKKYNNLLITITPPSPKNFKLFKPYTSHSTLILHNLNYWKQPLANIYAFKKGSRNRIFSFIKLIRYSFQIFIFRKNILTHFGPKIGLNKSIFENNQSILTGYLNQLYPEHICLIQSEDTIKIVAPGSTMKEREYEQIIQLLGKIALQKQVKIVFTIAGKTSSDLLYIKNNNFLKIVTFKSTLSQKDFEKIMCESDFALLPLIKEKEYRGIIEFKGKTNITGSVNDCYKYGIPFMIPQFYQLEDSVLHAHFNDIQDLEYLIENWILNKEFLKIKLKLKKEQKTLKQKALNHNLKLIKNLSVSFEENN